MRTLDSFNRRLSAARKSINSSVFVLVVVTGVAAVNVLVLVVLELFSDRRHLRIAEIVFGSDRAVFKVRLPVCASKVETFFLSARARAAALEAELVHAVRVPVGFDFGNAERLLVVAHLNRQTFRLVGKAASITGSDSVVKLIDSDVTLVAADDVASFIVAGNAGPLVELIAVRSFASFFAHAEKSLRVGWVVDDAAFLPEELVVQVE